MLLKSARKKLLRKKKESKRLRKEGVCDSMPVVVQSASGDDDKTAINGDT